MMRASEPTWPSLIATPPKAAFGLGGDFTMGLVKGILSDAQEDEIIAEENIIPESQQLAEALMKALVEHPQMRSSTLRYRRFFLLSRQLPLSLVHFAFLVV